MKTALKGHLGEATLLRIAARDLGADDGRAARKHLESCVACRTDLASAKRVDRSLAKLAGALRKGESGRDPGSNAKYFDFIDQLFEVSEEAKEASERILRGARAAEPDQLEAALRALDGHAYRGLALLYSAQKADKLVAEDPNKALALAKLLSDEAESLPIASPRERTSTTAPRQAVQAVAALLESQALTQRGEAKASREAVRRARLCFQESGDLGFGLALCDFHEGTAAIFEKDYRAAQRLLKSSASVFAEFGQNLLKARAHAGLGTLFVHNGHFDLALGYLDAALPVFESEPDTGPQRTTMLLNNRATALMRLERLDEARATFAKALNHGRRHNHASHLFFIRTGLAELDFRRGEYRRALHAFTKIVREASPLASKSEILFSRLYAAECQARIGSYGPMVSEIETLRRGQREHVFAASPALDELFISLDQGSIDAGLIAHVREYLQAEENGVNRPYHPLRRAGHGGR